MYLSVLPLIIAAVGVSASPHLAGITVSNFKPNVSPGVCRTASDWASLAAAIKAAGFPAVRILGNDCSAFDVATGAFKAQGIPVLAGIYANSGTIAASTPQINEDVGAFVNAVNKYGASAFSGLTIGNEVNDTPINIMQKVWDVRGYLNNVIGYHGPISTVHTWVQVVNNPVLCDADRVTVNAHAYYDGNVVASRAGNFITDTVIPLLKQACAPYAAVNNIVITESGWPTAGATNGQAVPSPGNAQAALASLNCTPGRAGIPIYAFEGDDQTWKSTAVERSFGLLNKAGLSISAAFNSCA